MKLKTLIKRLQKLEREGHGDLEVVIDEGTMWQKIENTPITVDDASDTKRVVSITLGDELETR